MKVVALAGGTGSAKLLRGLARLPIDLTVVANVGDNFWAHGIYVCPDIDIAVYTLAGIADPARGWGIAGDTFNALAQLGRLGRETWFNLGDKDMALSLMRTELMRNGKTLTEVTRYACDALGAKCVVLPVTDSPVETHVITPLGGLHLQVFWVKERGAPRVTGVRYKGAGSAHPTDEVMAAISAAERVVVCPANPVTSVGPMLAIPRFRALLSKSRARVVALSPMVGGSPFSGPAGKLMRATGSRSDSLGVAQLYSDFLDVLVISKSDGRLRSRIEALGIRSLTDDTSFRDPSDEVRLARVLLEA